MKCWLQISAGVGPEECCWVVSRVAEVLEREGRALALELRRLNEVTSLVRGNARSVLYEIAGPMSAEFVSGWVGTTLWKGESAYRPGHRRKNWYVAVSSIEVPRLLQWDETALELETKRGSGPGGQNRNKRDTAVRLRHREAGLSVSIANQRSQYANKREAKVRMEQLFEAKNQDALAVAAELTRANHYRLERGNPVRIYRTPEFRRVER